MEITDGFVTYDAEGEAFLCLPIAEALEEAVREGKLTVEVTLEIPVEDLIEKLEAEREDQA